MDPYLKFFTQLTQPFKVISCDSLLLITSLANFVPMYLLTIASQVSSILESKSRIYSKRLLPSRCPYATLINTMTAQMPSTRAQMAWLPLLGFGKYTLILSYITFSTSPPYGISGDECFKASAYLTDCYLTSTANSLPPTQLATPPSSSPILSPTHSPMTFSSGSPPDRIDEPATPKQNQGLRSAFDAYNQRTPTTPLSPSVPLASSSGAQARGLRKKISMSFLSNSPAPSSSVTEHTSTIPWSPVATKSPGLLKRMGSRPLLGPAFSLAGMKDAGAKMGKKASVGSFTSSDGRGSGNNGGLGSTPGTPSQVYPLAPANSPASFGNMSPYPSRKPSLASLYSPPSPTSSSPPPVPPLPSSSKIAHFASSSSLDLLSSPAIAVGRVEKGPPKRMSSRSSLLSGSGLGSVPPSPTVATAPVTTRRGHHRNTSSLSPIPDASAPSRYAAMRKSPPFLDSDAVPVVNSTPSAVPRITPAHPMYAPFNVAFQTDRPYFEWLEGEGNSGRLKRFGKAMTGTGNWDGAAIIDCKSRWGVIHSNSCICIDLLICSFCLGRSPHRFDCSRCRRGSRFDLDVACEHIQAPEVCRAG